MTLGMEDGEEFFLDFFRFVKSCGEIYSDSCFFEIIF